MIAGESRTWRPSRLELTSGEFERRLAARGHDAEEIARLWEELVGADREPVEGVRAPGLGLGPLIAVYLGLLLLVAACVSLLGIYWDDLGAAGILALGLAYLTGYLVASEILRRREIPQAADVLEAVAVGWVGLSAYAAQELTGLWPEAGSGGEEIHRGLTWVAVVGSTAAVLLLALRPAPPLVVPLAAGMALLAVDLAEAVFGERLDDLGEQRALSFALPLGIAWIAVGLWLDTTRRRRFATWVHGCGLVIAGAAVLALVPKTVPGFALVGCLGAVALFFSAFVRHWSFTVVGAAGVLVATSSALGLLGGIAPLVIALVGVALIVVGLRWWRWRESVRTAVLTRLPPTARGFLERLAP